MESFIEEYISSVNAEDVNEEILLERRISPYATLRPGDLAALLKLQSSIPLSGSALKSGWHHGPGGLETHVEEILKREEQGFSSDESGNEGVKDEELRDVVCRGDEQNHVPAVYTVRGLRRHEMPVVGVYVDKRVCPGFRYRVRRAGSNRFFFQNEARTLESIGMGYGKRLTFTGEQRNNNENYFWSDSEPEGYAFSIQAVDEGMKFLVMDVDEAVVGEGVVSRIHEPQEETTMTAGKDGVTKRVAVTLTCSVTYYHRHHYGLIDMMVHENQETISGEAVLHKSRKSRKASLVSVEGVFLQRVGQCKFIPDC
ncbi:uncharacterized protein LOC101847164 [Aplysia californica]|uniref:Uncharacterized protein LOC101847164 n=1 Tax=Aplysia californica TaxID=6500 RepID=A0ABM0K9E4_APLCA|nr:uncharacterized protein LOC101847164 [Aplysia californica]